MILIGRPFRFRENRNEWGVSVPVSALEGTGQLPVEGDPVLVVTRSGAIRESRVKNVAYFNHMAAEVLLSLQYPAKPVAIQNVHLQSQSR